MYSVLLNSTVCRIENSIKDFINVKPFIEWQIMNFQKQNWLNKLSNLCKNSSNVCTLYNVHYCLFVSIYATLLCIEHTLSIVIIVAYVNNKINTTDLLSVQGDKKIFKKNIHNVYLKQLIFIFP